MTCKCRDASVIIRHSLLSIHLVSHRMQQLSVLGSDDRRKVQTGVAIVIGVDRIDEKDND